MQLNIMCYASKCHLGCTKEMMLVIQVQIGCRSHLLHHHSHA